MADDGIDNQLGTPAGISDLKLDLDAPLDPSYDAVATAFDEGFEAGNKSTETVQPHATSVIASAALDEGFQPVNQTAKIEHSATSPEKGCGCQTFKGDNQLCCCDKASLGCSSHCRCSDCETSFGQKPVKASPPIPSSSNKEESMCLRLTCLLCGGTSKQPATFIGYSCLHAFHLTCLESAGIFELGSCIYCRMISNLKGDSWPQDESRQPLKPTH